MGIEDILEHEQVVNKLFKYLTLHSRSRTIYKHVFYSISHKEGECDILSYHTSFVDYYEVKKHFCQQSFNRALKQFARFKETHPDLRPRFIYVSPTKVKRVYL